MSKEADRAALAAMLAATTKTATRIPAAPMAPTLSASRNIASEAVTKVEKQLEARNFATPKKAKKPRRNQEAQRRYDEQHGTSNGYDERIEDALAMRRRESGDY